MRKAILILLSVIIIFKVSGQEILTNGGFESDLSGWIVRQKASSFTNASLLVQTTEKHSGSKALKASCMATANYFWDSVPSCKIISSKIFDLAVYKEFQCTRGEVYKLTFWMNDNFKTNSSSSARRFRVEMQHLESGKWKSYEYLSMSTVESGWQQYEMRFWAEKTGTARIIFGFGNAKNIQRNIYLDDVSFQKIGTVDADNWKTHAQSIIDTLRKANFKVIVKDKNGKLLPNASLSYKLIRHDFDWGVGTSASETANSSFQNALKGRMNALVSINEFKWKSMETTQGSPNYNDINTTLNFAKSKDMTYRGHCFIWGRSIPSWADTESEFIERCRVMSNTYKGKVIDYDVVNEPFTLDSLSGNFSRTSIAKYFNKTKDTDPTGGRFINNYNSIIGPFTFTFGRLYRDLMSTYNAPITGIGHQGHMDKRVNYGHVFVKFQFFSDKFPECTQKVTEFDLIKNNILNNEGISTYDNNMQADDYEKMMYLAYSNPTTTALITWSFKDNTESFNGIDYDYQRLYDASWNKKPAADRWYNQISTVWNTSGTGTSDANGEINFNGYCGKYEFQLNNEKINLNLTKKSLTANFNSTVAVLLDENYITETFTVGPNPVTDYLIIKGASVNSLIITNSIGQIVDNYSNIGTEFIVNFSTKPKGVYFVTLMNNEQKVTEKIVKQ